MHQVEPDQSHVVGERHPRQADILTLWSGLPVHPRQLAMMLAWVKTTPLGSLVDPDENWMKATSFG